MSKWTESKFWWNGKASRSLLVVEGFGSKRGIFDLFLRALEQEVGNAVPVSECDGGRIWCTVFDVGRD